MKHRDDIGVIVSPQRRRVSPPRGLTGIANAGKLRAPCKGAMIGSLLSLGAGNASVFRRSGLHRTVYTGTGRSKDMTLVWRKPKIVEIAVGLEINSYACAEV